LLKQAGLPAPAAAYAEDQIMGKRFDADAADGYLELLRDQKNATAASVLK
jgi:hypothetical protein